MPGIKTPVRIGIVMGEMVAGRRDVTEIVANIPEDYLEVEVIEATAKRRATGEVVQESVDLGPGGRDKWPFEVWQADGTSTDSQRLTASDVEKLSRGEFEVALVLPEADEMKWVLVLGAQSVEQAVRRVAESYPTARVTQLRSAVLLGHPIDYLSWECLVVRTQEATR